MKRYACILSIIIIAVISACRKESMKGNVPLVGHWVAVQGLADPGDGSGTWQPVQIKSDVQFSADGEVSGSTFEGYTTYALKDSVTLTLIKPDKTYEDYYYVIRHDTLTMSPRAPVFCYEACGIRLKKK